MKTYEGRRHEGAALVTVNGKPLDPCTDIRSHSPSGLEWGYAGSGPAQLALALVADFLRIRELRCTCPDIPEKRRFEVYHEAACALGVTLERLSRTYQRFKELFVVRFKRDGWSLSEEDVRVGLLELEHEERARGKMGGA